MPRTPPSVLDGRWRVHIPSGACVTPSDYRAPASLRVPTGWVGRGPRAIAREYCASLPRTSAPPFPITGPSRSAHPDRPIFHAPRRHAINMALPLVDRPPRATLPRAPHDLALRTSHRTTPATPGGTCPCGCGVHIPCTVRPSRVMPPVAVSRYEGSRTGGRLRASLLPAPP